MTGQTYTVNVTREGRWWMVAIPELDGLTQARNLREVEVMARDYIAGSLDVPEDSFEIVVRYLSGTSKTN